MSNGKFTTIGEVLTLQRGFDITQANQRQGNIPVVSSGGVRSYHDTAVLEGPGVVIGRKGTLGKVFYLPSAYWPHDTTLWVKDFKGNLPKFVYYFFKNLDVASLDVGSANPTLNRNHVHRLRTYWPSLPEQEGIAHVLSCLDNKIALNTQIAAMYEEILELSFKALGIDQEPAGGERMILQDLVELNPPTPALRTTDAIYVDMAVLPTKTARVREWQRRPPKSGTHFQNGDTVMARITPCLENGKTAFIDFMADGETGVGSTEFIVLRARDEVPVHIPYFLARSPRFRAHAIQNMVGSSGRQRVSAAALKDFELSYPGHEALVKFGQTAAAAFAHMKSLDMESHNLGELRDALLPGLMSGEIRVRDAEKEVENMT